MQLQKLFLLDFKNYVEADFSFGPKINCFTGNNGVGKTNILDAIHYLSLCKSHLNTQDSLNIRHGRDSFMIQGEFLRNGLTEQVHCGVKQNQKKHFQRNKKEYSRLSDHIGLFPSIMVSPSDNALIGEGSVERRRFMDSAISQFDKVYLEQLVMYQKAVYQRNALLKSFQETHQFSPEMLSLWDDQMIQYGEPVFSRREDFIRELTPVFQYFYQEISGAEEKVELVYSSRMHHASLKDLLAGALSRDRILQYTTVGPHKDDLQWMMNGFPIRKFGSQGQQKSFLTALKFANYDFIAQKNETRPILLLDDLFDKFDNKRVENIVRLVSGGRFGQIFITDTHTERMKELLAFSGSGNRHFLIHGDHIEIID
ncbi:MAG: DNA replication and repair protein RecF [Bacteroidales bacterium]|nr:DNA replication and repair protein RecF [Bacteroidales bacterium]